MTHTFSTPGQKSLREPNEPMFFLRTMTESDAKLICTWRYPTPYDVYNWKPWEEMLTHQLDFADPAIREKQYYTVTDVSGELIGFAQLFPMVGLTRIGLGMRPELCGQRSGQAFMTAIIQEACQRASRTSNELDLEVLTWNVRAIHVYQQAGFQINDTYMRPTPTGTAEVHCMVYVPINETHSNPTVNPI